MLSGCSASGVCKNAATEHVLVSIRSLSIHRNNLFIIKSYFQQQEDMNLIHEQEDQNRMLNETFDLGRKRSQPSSKENSRT